MDKILRIDVTNIALIIASCALAHYLPFDMVLFSYAFIGPAHYLTQISWMHDRNYFVSVKNAGVIFVIMTILCMMMPNLVTAAAIIAIIMAVSLYCVMPNTKQWKITGALLGTALVLSTLFSLHSILFFAVLLPTVIHIFVFTACFMWSGAIRSKRISSYVAFGALLVCAATFFLPTSFVMRPDMVGLQFFDPIVAYLRSILPLSDAAVVQVFGFLSFAYTYHYLNWFSKAEVIQWHRIPRKRLAAIVAIYIVAISVYLYDYVTGFMFILFLGQLHVFLEFPLNLRTFAYIGGSFKKPKPLAKQPA